MRCFYQNTRGFIPKLWKETKQNENSGSFESSTFRRNFFIHWQFPHESVDLTLSKIELLGIFLVEFSVRVSLVVRKTNRDEFSFSCPIFQSEKSCLSSFFVSSFTNENKQRQQKRRFLKTDRYFRGELYWIPEKQETWTTIPNHCSTVNCKHPTKPTKYTYRRILSEKSAQKYNQNKNKNPWKGRLKLKTNNIRESSCETDAKVSRSIWCQKSTQTLTWREDLFDNVLYCCWKIPSSHLKFLLPPLSLSRLPPSQKNFLFENDYFSEEKNNWDENCQRRYSNSRFVGNRIYKESRMRDILREFDKESQLEKPWISLESRQSDNDIYSSFFPGDSSTKKTFISLFGVRDFW